MEREKRALGGEKTQAQAQLKTFGCARTGFCLVYHHGWKGPAEGGSGWAPLALPEGAPFKR